MPLPGAAKRRGFLVVKATLNVRVVLLVHAVCLNCLSERGHSRPLPSSTAKLLSKWTSEILGAKRSPNSKKRPQQKVHSKIKIHSRNPFPKEKSSQTSSFQGCPHQVPKQCKRIVSFRFCLWIWQPLLGQEGFIVGLGFLSSFFLFQGICCMRLTGGGSLVFFSARLKIW